MAYSQTLESPWVTGRYQMPTPMGSEVVNVNCALAMTTDEVDSLVAGDIIHMANLPEDCTLVDLVAADTVLDTNVTETMDLDLGIINGDGDDFVTTTGELQNSILVAGTTHAARVTPTVEILTTTSGAASPTKLGYKVAAAAATAAAGTLYLSVSYRAKTPGE